MRSTSWGISLFIIIIIFPLTLLLELTIPSGIGKWVKLSCFNYKRNNEMDFEEI